VVLGVEEELNGVANISTDVAGTVDQLSAWADLDRVSCGGTSGGRTRGGVGRLRCGSIHTTSGRKSERLCHRHCNFGVGVVTTGTGTGTGTGTVTGTSTGVILG